MIHFFPAFAKDASQSPFALELKASGVEHRLLGFEMRLQYRSRLWLLMVGWPRLFMVAARSAWRSQIASRPAPDTVVLNSDIEVLVFAAFKLLRMSRGPKIVLLGFIFTSRRSQIANRLRHAYFSVVMSMADTVICYSKHEADSNRRLFAASGARFVHIPFGLHVEGQSTISAAPVAPPYVLAAGRSGRDYRTLFDAVRGRDIAVRVICDSAHAIAGLDVPSNVTVLRDCYGANYFREIGGASVVAVPLAVNDISAGQMVMLQAMAFGKPIVVTRTTTIDEYVTDRVEALLVERNDAAGLWNALTQLLASPETSAAMGARGLHAFQERFSMRAYVRHVLAAIRCFCGT